MREPGAIVGPRGVGSDEHEAAPTELDLGELEVLSAHSRTAVPDTTRRGPKRRRILKPKVSPKFEHFKNLCIGHPAIPFRALPDPSDPPEVIDLLDPDVVWEDPHDTVEMEESAFKLALASYYAWAANCLSRYPGWQRPGREPFALPPTLLKTLKYRSAIAAECRSMEAAYECLGCGQLHRSGYPKTKCGSLLCPACGPVLARPWVYAPGWLARTNPPGSYSYITCVLSFPKTIGLSVPRLRFDLTRLHRALDWIWEKAWRAPALGSSRLGPGLLGTVEVSETGRLHLHVVRRGLFVPDAELERLLVAREDGLASSAVASRSAWHEGEGGPENIDQHQQYVAKGSKFEDVGETAGKYLHPLVVVLTEIALYRQRRRLLKGSMTSMMTSYEKTRAAETRAVKNGLCSCGSSRRRHLMVQVPPDRIDPRARKANFVRYADELAASFLSRGGRLAFRKS